jgi:alpha-galactosidase
MLEVGNGHLSPAFERIHFSLWCVLAAPLLVSANLETLSEDSLAVLTNRAMIAVNQDSLGVQGKALQQRGPGTPVLVGGWGAWAKPLNNGSVCLFLVNTGETSIEVSVSWGEIGLSPTSTAVVVDLWTGVRRHCLSFL